MAYDIGTLPDLSRRVLVRLHECLHDCEGESGKERREWGFSDIEGSDMAQWLGTSPQVVGGTLDHLVEERLAWVEDTDVNGCPYRFLHLTEAGFLACGCPPHWPEEEA